MKNQKNKIKLYVCLCLLFSLAQVNAQFFTSTTNHMEYAPGVTFSTGITGNDIYYVGGNTFKVSTYQDGSSAAGIAWQANISGFSGNVSLTNSSDVILSDVCFVYTNSLLYAVVAYYVAGDVQNWYCESFVWGSATFTSTGTATILMTGYAGTTVHIDSDQNNHFVIVWDDASPDVFVATGSIIGGPANQVVNSSGVYWIDIAQKCMSPDVAIFYDVTNTTGYVYVTFTDDVQNTLVVDYHDYAALAAFTNSPSNQLNQAYTVGVGYTFHYPRIACPNSTGGNIDDWTVVVDENDGSSYYINGFNNANGTVSSVMGYNDATNDPLYDITAAPNHFPVVTYDDLYPIHNSNRVGIWVGWTIDNSPVIVYGGAYVAKYPVVIKCNDAATPVSSTNYWHVPTLLSNGHDQVDNLSLSGRHALDELFLTYQVINSTSYTNEIITKGATPSSDTHLRSINNAINPLLQETKHSLLDINNSGSPFTLRLFDLTGKIILEEKGTVDKIREDLRLNRDKFLYSVYLASIIADDGSVNISRKIYIGN